MIEAISTENYKNITKVAILDSKKVFYPLSYVINKRSVQFDDDQAVIIRPIPEDIRYPGSGKMTDAGMLRDYKIEISINNQDLETERKLQRLENRKVIVVLYHTYGEIIIGCNEMPLEFLFVDENSTKPEADNGFNISMRGNAYFLKVSR